MHKARVNRMPVGEPLQYKGHTIEAKFLGPDLLCYVDGAELGSFFVDAESARKGGMRYVDQVEKEKADKAGKK